MRPDAIHLAPANSQHILVGQVRHAAFLGTEMHYAVESPLGRVCTADTSAPATGC
ncbi:MAG: TOBE domain-containing protein [Rhodoferax sp.]|nr:TOBE domain-containing protein [Rhodoferax sp.]